MGKLKPGPVEDDKPVRLYLELSAETHRLLVAYAEAHARETGQKLDPAKPVAPMLARFMASDRGFMRGRARTFPPPP